MRPALPDCAGKDGKDGKDGLSGLVTRHYDYIRGRPRLPRRWLGRHRHRACDDDPAVSQTKVAIGGGVQFLDVGRNAGTLQNPYVGETHVTDSFPGRMDWDTNRHQGQQARRLDRPAQHHPVRGHARLGDLYGRALPRRNTKHQ